jgi:predicted RNA binding protein YcfA (HicA-like mRNA interferase family)
MPKLKTLSGGDLLRIFGQFGFAKISQDGSHVKLRRVMNNRRETLTIPMHRELDRGTVHAIFRQALRYIPERDLASHFFAAP